MRYLFLSHIYLLFLSLYSRYRKWKPHNHSFHIEKSVSQIKRQRVKTIITPVVLVYLPYCCLIYRLRSNLPRSFRVSEYLTSLIINFEYYPFYIFKFYFNNSCSNFENNDWRLGEAAISDAAYHSTGFIFWSCNQSNSNHQQFSNL